MGILNSKVVKAPTHCTYCNQEKDFLMEKPSMMAIEEDVILSFNRTAEPLWICLSCFTIELDSLGHTIEIREFDW